MSVIRSMFAILPVMSVLSIGTFTATNVSAGVPRPGDIVIANIYQAGGISIADFSNHSATSYLPNQGAADIAYGPDGNLYAAHEGTGTVYRYNGSGLVASYPGLPGVGSIAVRSDGTLLAASKNAGTQVVRKWSGTGWVDFASGVTLTGGRMVFGRDKTGDGMQQDLYVATTTGVYWWDGQVGGSTPTLFASKSGMTPSALAFRPTNGNLYVGTTDGKIEVFNGKTGAWLSTANGGDFASISDLMWGPDPGGGVIDYLYICSPANHGVWLSATGAYPYTYYVYPYANITSVDVVPPPGNVPGNVVVGNIFATGGVSVADFATHGTTSYLPDQGASDIGYGPDGDLYVANEATGTVYRYNGSNLVASYPGLTEVGSLVVRSDGTLLAASRATGTNVTKRWSGAAWVDFASGVTLTGGRMVFGPDKTSDGNADLFVATTAGVYYWDGQNGGSSGTLFASKSGMTPCSLAFRPTDGNLYVGTTDGKIQVFNGSTGAWLFTAEDGDFVAITDLIWGPDKSGDGVSDLYIVSYVNQGAWVSPNGAYPYASYIYPYANISSVEVVPGGIFTPPAHPAIIPAPQSTTYGSSSVTIGSNYHIACNTQGTGMSAAQRLQGRIQYLTSGMTIPIIDLANSSGVQPLIMIGEPTPGSAMKTICDSKGVVTDPSKGTEGHVIDISADGTVLVAGNSEAGSRLGTETLMQMFEMNAGSPELPLARINDWPALNMRAIMIGLQGSWVRPDKTFDWEFGKKLLRTLRNYKYNTLVLWITGTIQYTSRPDMSSAAAFPKAQVQSFIDYAKSLGYEVIPSLDCLGHMENWGLDTTTYPYLSSLLTGNTLNLSNPDALPRLFDVMDEVIAMFNPNYFYCGFDEAGDIGWSGKTNAQWYADHATALRNHLNAQNIKMMIAGDMLLNAADWGSEVAATGGAPLNTYSAIDLIPKDIVICDWQYGVIPGFPTISYFKTTKGFEVVGLPWRASAGATGIANAVAACNGLGIMETTWSSILNLPETYGNVFFAYGDLMSTILATAECSWHLAVSIPYDPFYEIVKTLYSKEFESWVPSNSQFFQVSLNNYYNDSLVDALMGDHTGWIDYGPLMDMSNLPVDLHNMPDVPFSINTGTNACILLKGNDLLGTWPTQVTGIPVNRQATDLYFLHTTSSVVTQGNQVGYYRVSYADGSSTLIPLISGSNIDCWRPEKCIYEPAPDRIWAAWAGTTTHGSGVIIYAYHWQNPQPNKVISSLDFVSSVTNTSPILLAITGAMIDTTAPSVPGTPTDAGAYTGSTSVTFNWTAATDSGSGIVGYFCQGGTSPGGNDVYDEYLGNVLSTTIAGTYGNTYYCRVQGKDAAGNLSAWSGNSDGIMVVPMPASIGDAKAFPDGTRIMLSGKLVTVGTDQFQNLIYVEDADRTGGLRIDCGLTGISASAGDMLTVVGVLSSASTERLLVSPELLERSPLGQVPNPIGMAGWMVGGGSLNVYTAGVTNGTGLHNTGLLIKIWGEVSSVNTTSKYFYLNDGSGSIKVSCSGLTAGNSITLPTSGVYAIVTGVSSRQSVAGQIWPVVRPRKSSDIQTL